MWPWPHPPFLAPPLPPPDKFIPFSPSSFFLLLHHKDSALSSLFLAPPSPLSPAAPFPQTSLQQCVSPHRSLLVFPSLLPSGNISLPLFLLSLTKTRTVRGSFLSINGEKTIFVIPGKKNSPSQSFILPSLSFPVIFQAHKERLPRGGFEANRREKRVAILACPKKVSLYHVALLLFRFFPATKADRRGPAKLIGGQKCLILATKSTHDTAAALPAILPFLFPDTEKRKLY